MFDDRIGNLQKMLARMGPEGRQRYAADHADDPIAVSMALFVNNIAKELKEGKRGEPEMQAPVVQQAIQAMNQPRMPQGMPPQGMPPQGQPQAPQQAPQAMPPQAPQQQGQTRMAADGGYMDSRLPEEMGIGALPERSLSNMADGGIVGFADRGLVNEITLPPKKENESFADYRQRAIKFQNDQMDAIAAAKRAKAEAERVAELTARGGPRTSPFLSPPNEMTTAPTQSAPAVSAPSSATTSVAQPVVDSMTFPARPRSNDPRILNQPNPVSPSKSAAAPAAAAASTTNVPTGTGLPSLASQFSSINVSGLSPAQILESKTPFEKGIAAIDPVATERAALNAKAKRFSEQALTDFEKEVKDRGDPYAKREERANKQEASIAESAERNPYLSLMEAGFAMMAGDSPYAMVNIGKGALVGTKAYKEGLDKIEKAKEKLSEARDKIEDYRINRDDLTAKERRAFKTDIRNTELEGDKNIIAGLALASGRKDTEVAAAMKAYQESFSDQMKTNAQIKIAQIGQEAENARNDANIAGALTRAKLQAEKTHALPTISTIANQLRTANPSLSVEKSLERAAELMSTSANIRANSNELIQNIKDANKQILAEGGMQRIMIQAEKDPAKKQILIDNWDNRQKEIKKLFNISDPVKAEFVGFEPPKTLK